MLGWEFPPYISGGLGTHCYELVRSLASRGAKVSFYMPQRPSHYDVPGVRITGVDVASEQLDIRILKKAGIKIKKIPYAHLFGPYPAVQMGPYEAPGVILGPYSGQVMISRGRLPPDVGIRIMNKRAIEENYGWDFFEIVSRYNERVVLEAMEDRFDLIHTHDWITVQAGITLKKLTGKPLVFTVHSTEYDRTANIYPLDWIVDIEKQGLREADLVITVSELMKRQLVERYGANPDKIRVVYNAIDASKFSVRINKDEIGVKDNLVLFLGRLSKQKGPIFFLRAAKRALEKEPNIKFVVAGKGDLLPQLINEAFRLGIQDKIIFTGYVPDEELKKLYAMADLYVAPSVSEPFGITILEAMASGTPAIISKTSGVSEVVHHCFKVDFWDTDEMANKIISVIRHKVLRDTLLRNMEREVKTINWGKTAEDTMRVYEEAVHA